MPNIRTHPRARSVRTHKRVDPRRNAQTETFSYVATCTCIPRYERTRAHMHGHTSVHGYTTHSHQSIRIKLCILPAALLLVLGSLSALRRASSSSSSSSPTTSFSFSQYIWHAQLLRSAIIIPPETHILAHAYAHSATKAHTHLSSAIHAAPCCSSSLPGLH